MNIKRRAAMEKPHSTLSAPELLDLYFLENRARLLEIASFLDRLDRAPAREGEDFRQRAFLEALELLSRPGADRTRAIQLCLSDPTNEPIESALGLKALGAWQGGEPCR